MPILETIAIKTVWGKAIDLLGKVPRDVFYVLAALAAWWWLSPHYIEQGREEVLAELRVAEYRAAKRSLKSVAQADEKAAERAEEEAEVISGMIEAIEQAEANNENALDSLF